MESDIMNAIIAEEEKRLKRTIYNRKYWVKWRATDLEKIRDKARTLARRRRAENPEKFKEKERQYDLKKEYGVTCKEFNKVFSLQGGRCAICGVIGSNIKRDKKILHVDHDHETHENRGLLCKRCNFMIGNARDNTVILENAINYLKYHKGG